MRRDDLMVWSKDGDCRVKADHALAQNRREHGGRVEGEPEVFYRPYGQRPKTFVAARDAWWQEYMRVHGAGWVGPIEWDDESISMIREGGEVPPDR